MPDIDYEHDPDYDFSFDDLIDTISQSGFTWEMLSNTDRGVLLWYCDGDECAARDLLI